MQCMESAGRTAVMCKNKMNIGRKIKKVVVYVGQRGRKLIQNKYEGAINDKEKITIYTYLCFLNRMLFLNTNWRVPHIKRRYPQCQHPIGRRYSYCRD
jgi:hypothetical protein